MAVNLYFYEDIKMIYITGDTHGDLTDSRLLDFTMYNKEDYVIILGDWGYGWNSHILKSFLSIDFPPTILFIDGNHENYDHLNSLDEINMFGSKVGVVKDGVYHLKRGELYTIEGKTFFCFGGARSIDKEYRTEGVSWWSDEEPSDEDFNHALDTLSKGNKFDYFLAHTCTLEIKNTFGYNPPMYDPTENYLSELVLKSHFKKFLFGHHHEFVLGENYIGLYKEILSLDDDGLKIEKVKIF